MFQAYTGLVPEAQAKIATADAHRAAERAVALNPRIPEPHIALGRILMIDKNYPQARMEFEKAIEIEPRNADAILQLGSVADDEGKTEETTRRYEQALALDPPNPNVLQVVAQHYWSMSNWAGADTLLRKVLELAPDSMFVYAGLGVTALLLGRLSEASEFMEKGAQDETDRDWAHALLYPSLGRQAEADASLHRLEQSAAPPAFDIAQIYAFRGDKDAAFKWLDRAYQTNSPALGAIHSEPFFRPLRGDPRYQDLLVKLQQQR